MRARIPRFSDWWHDEAIWRNDPMGPLFDWIAEEQTGTAGDDRNEHAEQRTEDNRCDRPTDVNIQ